MNESPESNRFKSFFLNKLFRVNYREVVSKFQILCFSAGTWLLGVYVRLIGSGGSANEGHGLLTWFTFSEGFKSTNPQPFPRDLQPKN